MKRLILTVCATLALAAPLAACSTATTTAGGASYANAEEKAVRTRADYWQRADSVSAQYMVGPKAQHQLNMDIASCVAEVKELVRLGSIRRASPPPGVGMEPGLRAGWASPTRDGPLYTEYTEFQDFESCMMTKGWERVDYVRPVAAKAASRNYVTTILGHPFGWGSGNSNIYSDRNMSQDNNFNR